MKYGKYGDRYLVFLRIASPAGNPGQNIAATVPVRTSPAPALPMPGFPVKLIKPPLIRLADQRMCTLQHNKGVQVPGRFSEDGD